MDENPYDPPPADNLESDEANPRLLTWVSETTRTRDALILVFVLSIPLAVWKIRVESGEHWVLGLALLWPAAFTAMLHLRFRLSLRSTIAFLYVLGFAYFFADGVVASITWNRTPHDIFERNTLPIHDPVEFGLFGVELWTFLGIPYAAVYACLAWIAPVSWSSSLFRTLISEKQAGEQ